MGSFINFLDELKGVEYFSFQVGYAAALGLVLLLLLLLLAVYVIFFRYPKRAPGVFINAPLGSVFISAHAISDLVKSLESEFKDIEISKVLLLDCKHFKRIEIQVDYGFGGQSMTEIAPSLQARTVDSLREVFGIEGIRDVAVRVRRGVSSHSPF